ncbi:hypothetical protein BEWA_002910 [Theileria equi strain WA]|uniref:Signal peptide containing protein n=1 Tax=Theileria equi strain WA TaxID=1537102 RepID=L0B1A8_THEEQ|nr:hypothetical protein BEWA_002910 [Theileria equi strain WA]AFZ80884.1 hypothetical protein BEWA_002910 [Theileria equi strain WA]|eukprot:XP_004830550.1 hypothetical protein BEWA_002910 [Theileria equi strain WA]
MLKFLFTCAFLHLFPSNCSGPKKSITVDISETPPNEIRLYSMRFGILGSAWKIKPEYDDKYKIGKVVDGKVIIKEDSELLEYRNLIIVYNPSGTTYLGINSTYNIPGISLGVSLRTSGPKGPMKYTEVEEFIGFVELNYFRDTVSKVNRDVSSAQQTSSQCSSGSTLCSSLETKTNYKRFKRKCISLDLEKPLDINSVVAMYIDDNQTKNYFIPNIYNTDLVICKIYLKDCVIDDACENLLDKTVSVSNDNISVDKIMKDGRRIITTFQMGDPIVMIEDKTIYLL